MSTKWETHPSAFSFIITFALIFLLIPLHDDASQLVVIRMLQNNCAPFLIKIFQGISNTISFFSIGLPLIFVIRGEFTESKKQTRSAGLFIGLSLLSAGLISYAFKTSVQALRPYEIDPLIIKLSAGGGYSFPSGHTTEAFAAATSLHLAWRNRLLSIIAFTWAFAVALARVTLGVHFPIDILAGMTMGTSVTFLYWRLSRPLKLLMNC